MSFQSNITGAINNIAQGQVAGAYLEEKKMNKKYGPTSEIASNIINQATTHLGKTTTAWSKLSMAKKQEAMEHMYDRLSFMRDEALRTDLTQRRAGMFSTEGEAIRAEGLSRKQKNINAAALEMQKNIKTLSKGGSING